MWEFFFFWVKTLTVGPHVRLNVFFRVFLDNKKSLRGKRKQQKPSVWSGSALSIPAPDGGVVAHGDQNAAVTTKTGLSDR